MDREIQTDGERKRKTETETKIKRKREREKKKKTETDRKKRIKRSRHIDRAILHCKPKPTNLERLKFFETNRQNLSLRKLRKEKSNFEIQFICVRFILFQ